jgi:hypothetical protein
MLKIRRNKMKELKDRLDRLGFAYMVCPRNMKKTILKEMLKLKKEIELKRKSG